MTNVLIAQEELRQDSRIATKQEPGEKESPAKRESEPVIPDHKLVRRIGKGAYGEVWLARNVTGVYRAVKVVFRSSFKSDRPYEREFSGIKKFEPISRSHPSQLPILHVGRCEAAEYFYYIMELADQAEPGSGHASVGAVEADRSGAGPDAAPQGEIKKAGGARVPGSTDQGHEGGAGAILQSKDEQADVDPDRYEPRTLKSELKARCGLPFQECLGAAISLTTALERLHQHGLIHRDIKPANIVFVNGVPKLADIGLVTRRGEAVTFVGTEGYFPPEGPGAPAADIYGLGKVIYEMATGRDRLDFPEIPTDFVDQDDHADLLELNEIILKACAERVRDRYVDARKLRLDLTALGNGHPLPYARQMGGGSSWDDPEMDESDLMASMNSVAVLPFVNMSADQDNEFLADGITEDLVTALSQVKGLHVPARTSSFVFKGKTEDIRRVGRALNVSAVVEGSVQKCGGRLRVTAQLVKASDGFHLWSGRFDREFQDVFVMQDDITRSIVKALQGELNLGVEKPLVKPQTANTEAYQLYLKGREFWNERGGGLEKALRYFELALLDDPDYPLALTGLADTQVLRAFYALAPAGEVLGKAKQAARKALSIDPGLAEAHSSLGMLQLVYDRDLPGSESSFLRAMELNPNYVPARYWYGMLLGAMGREKEALEQNEMAIELDPLGPVSHSMLAWNHLLHLHCEEAVKSASRTLELRPDWIVAKWVLGQSLCLMDDLPAAVKELEEAVEMSRRNSLLLATLAWAYAKADRRDRALELLDELSAPEHVRLAPKVFMGLARGAMGDDDRAIELVEAACREGEVWVPWLPTPRGSKDLSSTPQASELLRRITGGR